MTPDSPHADAVWKVWTRVFRAALRGLRDLYDPESGLMARHAERIPAGWRLHAPSARNTAMVLGALHRLDGLGIAHGLDTRAVERRLDSVSAEMSVPDTCLDLWSDAVGGGRRGAVIWGRLRPRLRPAALDALELAWAVAALSRHFPVAARRDEVARAAADLAARLLAHQHPGTGLFRASLRRRGLLRRLDDEAALASQVFPIYALVAFAEAFERDDALDAARRCAATLVPLQGPSGQWWRHYDVGSATVTGRYPVYSVNQDASVPVALLSLARYGSPEPWLAAVARGMAWECGDNEVSTPLIDDEAGCIARSIEPAGDGWKVSWDWFSYHPARAIGAVVEVGGVVGLNHQALAAAAPGERCRHGA